jgi:hypothetical protein
MQFTTTDWLTLALVVITGVYAWATFLILKANQGVVAAMRAQTEAQLRPYVVAYVSTRVGTTLLHLWVENTGKSAAVDLRMEMDTSFLQNAEPTGLDISKVPAFSHPIASLAPGARLPFVLGVGHTLFAEGANTVSPKVFSIKTSYAFEDRRYEEEHTIDLRPLLHTTAIQDPIADEIKALSKRVDSWMRKVN